jgi:hypothetical protein
MRRHVRKSYGVLHRVVARIAQVLALTAAPFAFAGAGAPGPTPLEAAHYGHYSSSADMSAYLDQLAEAAPVLAHKDVIGYSSQQRPIEALRLGTPDGASAKRRLTVLLVGSQHGGAEPAGGEALLAIARDLALGDLRPLLDTLTVIVVPNANPDGREQRRRANANRVNINTDFVLLSQPESRALVGALHRYAPQAVLDLHESAVLKRETLAREGYLTDFDAQVEIGNNPALPAGVHALTRELLPALIARITAGGLPAQHYIGEITSSHQPISNGGLTLRNFRNTAAATGAVSLLVETKLDPHHDHYSTYRNIAVRVARQRLCIRSFLAEIAARRREIVTRTDAARRPATGAELPLFADYALDTRHPTVTLPLRRLDTRALEQMTFPDHRHVVTADSVRLPARLAVTAHVEQLAPFLDRHSIRYETLAAPRREVVMTDRFAQKPTLSGRVARAEERRETIALPAGSLVVDLAQPDGLAALLLLDPRSTSSVFRYPDYAAWIEPGGDFFIHRSAERAP